MRPIRLNLTFIMISGRVHLVPNTLTPKLLTLNPYAYNRNPKIQHPEPQTLNP